MSKKYYGYIYKTTNNINGMFYIGRKKYLNSSNDDKYYLGSGLYLKRAFRFYGRKNFTKEIIEYCIDNKTLNKRERFWIKKLKARNPEIGYNILEGGEGNTNPIWNDPIIRAQIREKIKITTSSPEWKKKHSERSIETNSRPGVRERKSKQCSLTHSKPEYKEAVSKRFKGIPKSESQKQKMKDSWHNNRGEDYYKYLSDKSKGSKNPSARRIKQLTLDGELIREWDTISEAASHYKVSVTAISRVLRGKYWHCKQFKWEYYA